MKMRTRSIALVAALLALVAEVPSLSAQGTEGAEVIHVAAGGSYLITHPVPLQRISIANPTVADAVVVSAREIVINGKTAGSTSVLLWDNAGGREHYNVRVTPDAATLEANLRELFPDEEIRVRGSGGSLVLEGEVSSAMVAERALQIAKNSAGEATVADQMSVPRPGQVLLQVRFAEVSKSALERAGVNLLRWNPSEVSGGIQAGRPPALGGQLGLPPGDSPTQTLSDAVNLFLLAPDADLGVFIQALKTNGLFRSLAEPNLMAVHGQEATFLAGGEFPYPVVQGGANQGAVTIQFKEFGVKLGFTPNILPSGNIRLHVAPEVSTLDFANGLTLQGFNIPSILTRKAETEIELKDGQTFAIAGLIDNSMTESVTKIPVIGDIPILGSLFRSKELRENRSELLVLVTPRIVHPSDGPVPIPTGEADTWGWTRPMQASPSETAAEKAQKAAGKAETTDENAQPLTPAADDTEGGR